MVAALNRCQSIRSGCSSSPNFCRTLFCASPATLSCRPFANTFCSACNRVFRLANRIDVWSLSRAILLKKNANALRIKFSLFFLFCFLLSYHHQLNLSGHVSVAKAAIESKLLVFAHFLRLRYIILCCVDVAFVRNQIELNFFF